MFHFGESYPVQLTITMEILKSQDDDKQITKKVIALLAEGVQFKFSVSPTKLFLGTGSIGQ